MKAASAGIQEEIGKVTRLVPPLSTDVLERFHGQLPCGLALKVREERAKELF